MSHVGWGKVANGRQGCTASNDPMSFIDMWNATLYSFVV